MDSNNRKFQYGDGFFETIIFRDGQVSLWDLHWERIISACKTLMLEFNPILFDKETLKSEIAMQVKASGYSSARIKLDIWRTEGGFYTPNSNTLEYHISAKPHNDKFIGIIDNVETCTTVHTVFSPYSHFKCNVLPYVLAGIEKRNKKTDDLIILDQAGHVSETTNSNIFWKTGDTYYTPSLSCGCINGIMRQNIIGLINKKDLELIEGEHLIKSLSKANQIFFTNVTGIKMLSAFNGNTLNTDINALNLNETFSLNV